MKLDQLLYITVDNWKMNTALAALFAGLGVGCSAWWLIPAGVLLAALVLSGLAVLLSGSAQ